MVKSACTEQSESEEEVANLQEWRIRQTLSHDDTNLNDHCTGLLLLPSRDALFLRPFPLCQRKVEIRESEFAVSAVDQTLLTFQYHLC